MSYDKGCVMVQDGSTCGIKSRRRTTKYVRYQNTAMTTAGYRHTQFLMAADYPTLS